MRNQTPTMRQLLLDCGPNDLKIVFDQKKFIDGMLIKNYFNTVKGCFSVLNCTDTLDFVVLFADWVDINKPNLERIYDAINSDYNPLENYDRHEVIRNVSINTKKNSIVEVTENNMSTTESFENYNDTVSYDNGSGGDKFTVQHSDKAYNSSSLTVTSSDTTDGKITTSKNGERTLANEGDITKTTTYTDKNNNDFTDITEMGTKKLGDDGKYIEDENWLHGNIGVTKAQDMLRDEINIRKMSMVKIVCELFGEEYIY